jgi:hypothetical protein
MGSGPPVRQACDHAGFMVLDPRADFHYVFDRDAGLTANRAFVNRERLWAAYRVCYDSLTFSDHSVAIGRVRDPKPSLHSRTGAPSETLLIH